MNDKQAQARLDTYTALKAKNVEKFDKLTGKWVNEADIMLANIERIDAADEARRKKAVSRRRRRRLHFIKPTPLCRQTL